MYIGDTDEIYVMVQLTRDSDGFCRSDQSCVRLVPYIQVVGKTWSKLNFKYF